MHGPISYRAALSRLYSRDIIDIRLNQASSRSLLRCADTRAVVTALLLLEKMISTGQRSSILATHREFRPRKLLSAKHPRLILLQGAQNKLSGMILLQETTAPVSRVSMTSQSNSIRICMFLEISAREGRGRKSLRMISLQNSKNKPFGMILLRKKWGGGVAHLSCQTLSTANVPARTSSRSGASRR